MIVNDVNEFRTYRNSISYYNSEGIKFSAVLAVDNSTILLKKIEEKLNFDSIELIRHPFDFDTGTFEDKTKWRNYISSNSRMTSIKKTHIMLDVAARLGNKAITVYGREKGLYWYNTLSKHPNKNAVMWGGEFGHWSEPFREAAFGIDLAFYFAEGLSEGKRTQWTTIEAIACGAIPIGFDTWRWENGYDGIWLPSPDKIGAKFNYDLDGYAEAIESCEYEFDMAVSNLESMRNHCDPNRVGKDYLELFGRIV
jgi:hypothetical protein